MSDDIDNVLKYIQNKFNITIHDVNSFENEASQLISDPRGVSIKRYQNALNKNDVSALERENNRISQALEAILSRKIAPEKLREHIGLSFNSNKNLAYTGEKLLDEKNSEIIFSSEGNWIDPYPSVKSARRNRIFDSERFAASSPKHTLKRILQHSNKSAGFIDDVSREVIATLDVRAKSWGKLNPYMFEDFEFNISNINEIIHQNLSKITGVSRDEISLPEAMLSNVINKVKANIISSGTRNFKGPVGNLYQAIEMTGTRYSSLPSKSRWVADAGALFYAIHNFPDFYPFDWNAAERRETYTNSLIKRHEELTPIIRKSDRYFNKRTGEFRGQPIAYDIETRKPIRWAKGKWGAHTISETDIHEIFHIFSHLNKNSKGLGNSISKKARALEESAADSFPVLAESIIRDPMTRLKLAAATGKAYLASARRRKAYHVRSKDLPLKSEIIEHLIGTSVFLEENDFLKFGTLTGEKGLPKGAKPLATLARIERWLDYEKKIKEIPLSILGEESASKTAIGIAMNNNSLLNAHNKALYDLKKSNPRLYGDVIKVYHKYGPSADEVNKVVRFPNDWNKWYKTWNESGNAKAAYNVAKRHGVYLNSPEDHVRFATFHEYGHIKSGFAKSTHEEVFLDLINKKFKTEHTSLTEAVNGINSTFGEERASNVLWKLQSLAADSDIIPRIYRGKKEEAAADIFAIKMMKKEAHMVGNISVKNASNAVKRTSNMTSNGYKLLSRVFTRK